MGAIRRRLWWALVAISALYALLGLGDMTSGIAFEPTSAPALTGKTLQQLEAESRDAYRVLDAHARDAGVTLVVAGVALTAIGVFSYRRGERWAWWTMWLLPAWSLAILVLGLGAGVAPGQSVSTPALTGGVFAAIEAAVLLLDARRFSST